MKLALPQVTLVCVDTRSPALAWRAIARCRAQVDFGRCVFVTDAAKLDGLAVDAGVDVVEARIDSIEAYSTFMVHGLADHVATSHALVVQWDGFVADASRWDPSFLDFDYIGAPWPDAAPGCEIGNGGFSLRSRRLLDVLANGDFAARHPEDVCICVDHRARLEDDFGLRWPSIDRAARFSFEHAGRCDASFGFHGLANMGDVLERAELHDLLARLPDAAARSLDASRLCERSIARGDLESASLLLAARSRLGMHDRRTLRARLKLALARARSAR
jgi:hypothetical protein